MAQPGEAKRRLGLAAALIGGLMLHGAASAQGPGRPFADTVTWTVSAPETIKAGATASVTVQGSVLEGWHVYAPEQAPRGPIGLSVELEPSKVAAADGEPTVSTPIKAHDPSFGFETQYYAKPFTLTVPVRIGKDVAPGAQRIPVSVQFQTCNGKICQPPKTVHLSASINVRPAG